MSANPTDKELIVALDFEGRMNLSHSTPPTSHIIPILGVHSIERSVQEDTLLVLFNTAISNMVCHGGSTIG